MSSGLAPVEASVWCGNRHRPGRAGPRLLTLGERRGRIMKGRLQQILDAHELPCGATIDATGKVAAEAGDFIAFASDGLVSTLLGPYGSARETLASLEGQLLPRMWSQGDEYAIVDLATEELAVVVFGRGRLSAPERWAMSKAVSASIRLVFGEVQDGL
jgi:hypothetical protein